MNCVRKYPNSAVLRKQRNSQKRSFSRSFVIFSISSDSCNNTHLEFSLSHFRERFYEGSISIWKTEKAVGPVVQLGKTSPSRGEDRRFKSGSAHFCAVFLLYWRIKTFIKYHYLRYNRKLRGHKNGKKRQGTEPCK